MALAWAQANGAAPKGPGPRNGAAGSILFQALSALTEAGGEVIVATDANGTIHRDFCSAAISIAGLRAKLLTDERLDPLSLYEAIGDHTGAIVVIAANVTPDLLNELRAFEVPIIFVGEEPLNALAEEGGAPLIAIGIGPTGTTLVVYADELVRAALEARIDAIASLLHGSPIPKT